MAIAEQQDLLERADPYRRELLAHCYRMMGSIHDAEDMLQETLERAWKASNDFEGRSSLRTWLYRIATNTCLSALQSRRRSALPSGLGPATDQPGVVDLGTTDAVPWVGPAPSARLAEADPASVAELRISTRLALIAAFQHLLPRQRAVLLLVEVVGYGLPEVAEFLDISYPAARSLLQRARTAMRRAEPSYDDPVVIDPDDAVLLERYLEAFIAADTGALAKLLKADAAYEMPPIAQWFRGIPAIVDHHERRIWGSDRTALATSANGQPALATYARHADGRFELHSIQVLEIAGGLIQRITVFRDVDLADAFALARFI